MRAPVALALLAGWILAAPANAGIVQLLGKAGARCVFHRDGKLLGSLAIPEDGTGNSKAVGLVGPLVFDSNASHSDILMSCTLGDMAEAHVLRYGRQVGEWVGPVCVTQKVGQKVDCPPSGGPIIDHSYPELVRAFFPAAVNFPQMLVYYRRGATPIVADLELSSISDGKTVHTLSFEQQQTLVHAGRSLLELRPLDSSSCASTDLPERLDFVTGNASHPYLFNAACMRSETRLIVTTMRCAAEPGGAVCHD